MNEPVDRYLIFHNNCSKLVVVNTQAHIFPSFIFRLTFVVDVNIYGKRVGYMI